MKASEDFSPEAHFVFIDYFTVKFISAKFCNKLQSEIIAPQ